MINPASTDAEIQGHLRALPIWAGPVSFEPLVGGLCNKSFVATCNGRKYVVRIGSDIWVHGIVQACVQNAMRAAAAVGVSAPLRHAEPSVVVSDFVEGRPLRPEDIQDEKILEKLVARIRQLHGGINEIRGSLIHFWPFQVVRHYVRVCQEKKSRVGDELEELARHATALEKLVPAYLPVFTHNDVVPQNALLDAGGEVYLIDWDYGAYGHSYFDVAGIATNADANADIETRILELYAGTRNDENWRQFQLFKLIINLREFLWGAVQEVASNLDATVVSAGMSQNYPGEAPGYEGYTEMNRRRYYDNLARFRAAYG